MGKVGKGSGLDGDPILPEQLSLFCLTDCGAQGNLIHLFLLLHRIPLSFPTTLISS